MIEESGRGSAAVPQYLSDGRPPAAAPAGPMPEPEPELAPVSPGTPPARPQQREDLGPKLSALALALGTLAAVGASLALAVQQAALPADQFSRYLGNNQLAPSSRSAVLFTMFGGALVPLLLCLPLLIRRRLQALPALTRVARIVSPLVLAWTLPSLLAYQIWYDQPLPYLVYLSAVLLAEERLLRLSLAALPAANAAPSPRSERRARFVAFGVVLAAAAAYGLYAAHYSLIAHYRLTTSAYDLGIFDNLIFNNLHGKFFRSPVLAPNLSYLSNHAEFGTILYAPLYAIHPSAATLLVLQAIFTSAAAIPLYLFASTQLPRLSAVLIALGYLLYAPLHGPTFYDFHWMPMTVPLWFGLFYAIAIRKRWLITLLVCGLIPMREEVGVMLAVLGVFLTASGYWFRLGITLAIVGAAWFGLAKFVIMPLAGTWWFANMYADLISPGEHGYPSVVRTLIVNPNFVWKTLATETKLVFFLHLMAPLAFLPFRNPLLAFLAIPGFFFTLLTTSYPHTISIRFQYTTHWIPWVFGASVLALKLIGQARGEIYRRAALGALLLGVFAHSFVYGAILQRSTFVAGFQRLAWGISSEEQTRYNKLKELAAKIPRAASVAATETECPHVSNRLDAYTLRVAHGNSDYLLVRHGMLGSEERKNLIAAMTENAYGLLDSGHQLYLFKKGHHGKETRAALRKLGVSLPSNAKTRDTE